MQVVAAADAQTNSVVVRGPAESLDLVANVIKVLDDTTAKVADVRVFQLRYADAMNTADVINQLFGQNQSSSRSGTGGGGRGFMGGGPMMFQGPFGQQGEISRGPPVAVQVTAAADSRANTVVVTGPETILTVVEDVVKKLDQPLSNVADVKVFHLEYADASNTAQLINEVFGQSRTVVVEPVRRAPAATQNQQIQFGFGGWRRHGGIWRGRRPAGADKTTSGSDIPVVASADTRTNSVVVSGPPETLKVIEQIIKELDSNPEQERRIFVYSLKNGTATSLMTILNNSLPADADPQSAGHRQPHHARPAGRETPGQAWPVPAVALGAVAAPREGALPAARPVTTVSPRKRISRPTRTPIPCW